MINHEIAAFCGGGGRGRHGAHFEASSFGSAVMFLIVRHLYDRSAFMKKIFPVFTARFTAQQPYLTITLSNMIFNPNI